MKYLPASNQDRTANGKLTVLVITASVITIHRATCIAPMHRKLQYPINNHQKDQQCIIISYLLLIHNVALPACCVTTAQIQLEAALRTQFPECFDLTC